MPFTALKRLDSVLLKTKLEVLEEFESIKSKTISKGTDLVLKDISDYNYYNTSKYVFTNLEDKVLPFSSLKDDADNIEANLLNFINGFSEDVRDIMDRFEIRKHIAKLEEKNLLYLVVAQFIDGVDLHPEKVSNIEMGYIFEELIRRFSEQSNETAGEHFTPREVIKLMVNLLFIEDEDDLSKKGAIKTLYDPGCGTGGMLSVVEDYLLELNKDLKLIVYGQELNDEAYAICKSDMLIKGQNANNIRLGNSFSADKFPIEKFDYMLCNPPFGVDWKNVKSEIDKEVKRGHAGRFGAGTPKISDGQFLFLQHMISKMKQNGYGTRIGIVFNGSPLFSGGAGSGESEIRKWIIENDWLEAIVALPDQLFYNTGIFTYIWIVTNRKSKLRSGKVQLINAIHYYKKMKKSLGNKRNEISGEQINEITRIYGEFKECKESKIFDNDDFGYYDVTVERPLRLIFQVTEERINKLWTETSFINLSKSKKKGEAKVKDVELGKQLQENIISALKDLIDETNSQVYKNKNEFEKVVKNKLSHNQITVKSSIVKSILNVLSEKDENAPPVMKTKGNFEVDSDLRDHELIPLKEDIEDYFEREVKPFVPDTWIDEKKTKIGLEIPLTRYFYEFTELRELNEINRDIKKIEEEILGLIDEI